LFYQFHDVVYFYIPMLKLNDFHTDNN